jgi:TRAP-type C4-dicarboxylate transport system permease small subunit
MSYEKDLNLEAVPPAHGAMPRSAFGHLVDGLNGIGSLLIAAVMLLMCADVLLRDLANRPIDGVAEMVAMSIVVIVFLQLPATLRHGRMASADLFIDPFVGRRPVAGRVLRGLYSVTGVFACSLIAYASVPLFLRAWRNEEFLGIEGVFTFPMWPMRAVVVLGATLAAVQYLLLALNDWRQAGRRAR